jgi:hypothetical protein
MSAYALMELYGFDDGGRLMGLEVPAHESAASALPEMLDLWLTLAINTGSEPDAEPVAWGFCNALYWQVATLERQLSNVTTSLKEVIKEDDGSEIRSVELEEKTAAAMRLQERFDFLEACLDALTARYMDAFNRHWEPRKGSLKVKPTTAAILEAQDFMKGQKARIALAYAPEGTNICAIGDRDYADHKRVFDLLGRIRARHPDMILHHPGDKEGFSVIAAEWARVNNVHQVTHSPDFKRFTRAQAPFQRNQEMLKKIKPKGVVVFGKAPISLNLAQQAQKLKIPVMEG